MNRVTLKGKLPQDRLRCFCCKKPMPVTFLRLGLTPVDLNEARRIAVGTPHEFVRATYSTWRGAPHDFQLETWQGDYRGYGYVNGKPRFCTLRCCEEFAAAVVKRSGL